MTRATSQYESFPYEDTLRRRAEHYRRLFGVGDRDALQRAITNFIQACKARERGGSTAWYREQMEIMALDNRLQTKSQVERVCRHRLFPAVHWAVGPHALIRYDVDALAACLGFMSAGSGYDGTIRVASVDRAAVIRKHAEQRPQDPAFVFVRDGGRWVRPSREHRTPQIEAQWQAYLDVIDPHRHTRSMARLAEMLSRSEWTTDAPPKRVSDLVLELYRHTCQNPYCTGGDSRMSIDHMTPRSRGGRSGLDNLHALCRSCNSRKGTRTWDEFLREQQRTPGGGQDTTSKRSVS